MEHSGAPGSENIENAQEDENNIYAAFLAYDNQTSANVKLGPSKELIHVLEHMKVKDETHVESKEQSSPMSEKIVHEIRNESTPRVRGSFSNTASPETLASRRITPPTRISRRQPSDINPNKFDTLFYEEDGSVALICDHDGRQYLVQPLEATQDMPKEPESGHCTSPAESRESSPTGLNTNDFNIQDNTSSQTDERPLARKLTLPRLSQSMVNIGMDHADHGISTRCSTGSLTAMYLNTLHQSGTPKIINSSNDTAVSESASDTNMRRQAPPSPRDDEDTDTDPWRIDIHELTFLQKIGRGSYSEVYRGYYRETEVAIKVMHTLDEHDATAVTHFQKEVAILKHLRHPNIIQYMGSCMDPPHLCIVSEFEPNGSLYKLLHKTATPLTLDNKIMIALGTALGMNYLHQRKTPIIHGDLKSANLLVRTDYHVRICDFGLSTTNEWLNLFASSKFGTVEWAAPEVLNGSPSSLSSDVYSFGVVLWEIFTGELPWSECSRMHTMIAVGFRNEFLPIPEDIPVWAQDLMGACFAEAESRPTFQEIIHRLRSI